MTEPSIAFVIPAFDAAATLSGVIDELRVVAPRARITVVDDGSRDDTFRVARRQADACLRFDRNRGKGAALRAGFADAIVHQARVVVTIDADGQHDVRSTPDLIAGLAHADVVVGARRRTAAMPAGRRVTNRLSALAMERCIGRPVPDAQSGFRAMAVEVVRAVRASGDRYEFETAFLIVAARMGFRIGFVPIETRYPAGVVSRFRPLRDSARIVGTFWRLGMGAA